MIFYNWKHQQIFIETGLSTSLFALLCDQWDEEKLRLNHTIISYNTLIYITDNFNYLLLKTSSYNYKFYT